jgi:hypothetical protein
MLRLPFFTQLFLLVFIPLLLLAVYSGEAMPMRLAYVTQASSPGALYMTSHRQDVFLYKYFGFVESKPDVLFLGASRVLTFRAGFLNLRPDAGYNAGIAGGGMPDIEAFIDHLTSETAPEVMLLQVDQFWFNEDWQAFYIARPVDIVEIEPDHIVMVSRQVIRGILNGSFTVGQLLRRVSPTYGELALGINAIQTGIGYAADGALQMSPAYQIPEAHQLRLETALNEMRKGDRLGQYVRGDIPSEAAFEQLERIIDKALALDIEVIGFAPGYMPTVYAEMMASGEYTYIQKAMPRVTALFEDRNLHFFDFSDVSAYSTDAEFEDGNHSYEILSLRMYMQMVQGAPELLGPYSDLEGLQAMIDQAPNNVEVVPREPPLDK